jgi:hypothetical protein
MKRIIPVVLLFALLFNSAGYYIAYEFSRYLLHKEFAALLGHGCFDKEITVFSVFSPSTDPSLRRVDDREIYYRGNLYDIVKEVPKGRITTFYCLHDSKEEFLIAGMKSMHGNKKAQNILQHLVTIALPVTYSKSIPRTSVLYIYPSLRVMCADQSVIPFSPPPERS